MVKGLTLIAGAAMTFFARPSDWTRAPRDAPDATPFAGGSQHYFAFLSYSHRDEATAQWLHDALEKFRVPRHLVGRITDHGAVPRRLTPIFRDLKELPASGDLGTEIKAALAASQFLIVLCSPAAAESRWTNAEIETFKRAHPESGVFAVILSGEPFASEIAGREQEECLPNALRFKYDRRGRPTAKRAEPLAADFRGAGEARRLGFLKLVAGMLGVGLDDLVRRDTVRRQHRLAILAAASIAGMFVTSGLAITAIQSRDAARDQRREAEGLVDYMLGDLRTKLEPLGRLDVLDSVGARALDYYRKQDKGSLSDESLAQRSKALTLMGEIAQTRGDLSRALQLYSEAYAGTGEAARRHPDDPQRLFDHAQNVYWIGYIDWQRGQLGAAERAFREYRRLADAMISLDPGNPQWRLEGKYADSNLGTVLLEQNRFSEAGASFQQALASVEALIAADPRNSDYQKARLEALAWLADARKSEGRLDEALAQRERQLSTLNQLMAAEPTDKDYTRKAMSAEAAISKLFASRGDMARALAHARRGTALADSLVGTEPGNTEWLEFAAGAKLNLGGLLRIAGMPAEAGTEIASGCDMADRLAARERNVRTWNEDLRLQCLTERARLALAGGNSAQGLVIARQALGVANGSRGSTPVNGATFRASAYQLYGDALAKSGQSAAARDAWSRAARAWPANDNLPPELLALEAQSLKSAGDIENARRIAATLDGMGYRHPDYLRLKVELGKG